MRACLERRCGLCENLSIHAEIIPIKCLHLKTLKRMNKEKKKSLWATSFTNSFLNYLRILFVGLLTLKWKRKTIPWQKIWVKKSFRERKKSRERSDKKRLRKINWRFLIDVSLQYKVLTDILRNVICFWRTLWSW